MEGSRNESVTGRQFKACIQYDLKALLYIKISLLLCARSANSH